MEYKINVLTSELSKSAMRQLPRGIAYRIADVVGDPVFWFYADSLDKENKHIPAIVVQGLGGYCHLVMWHGDRVSVATGILKVGDREVPWALIK
jgi:hypothetical protein